MRMFLGLTLAVALMIIGVRDSERSKTPTPAPQEVSPAAQPAERDTLPAIAAIAKPRKVERREAAPKDGQLSPRGAWRWSTKAWAWQPVKQAGPAWVQHGQHAATVDHLVRAHGYSRASVERLTPAQRDIAHANAHNAAQSNCPGGVCPAPAYSRSRGLFRRR